MYTTESLDFCGRGSGVWDVPPMRSAAGAAARCEKSCAGVFARLSTQTASPSGVHASARRHGRPRRAGWPCCDRAGTFVAADVFMIERHNQRRIRRDGEWSVDALWRERFGRSPGNVLYEHPTRLAGFVPDEYNALPVGHPAADDAVCRPRRPGSSGRDSPTPVGSSVNRGTPGPPTTTHLPSGDSATGSPCR